MERVHFEMPFLRALCLPLQLHLPSLECFPSPHGRPVDTGPVSASCWHFPALWLLFLCLLLPRQLPFIVFLSVPLTEAESHAAAFSLSPLLVSAAKSDGDFISSYLLCLAFGIRHLL